MRTTETVLEGTIQEDGTLVLDEPTELPAGRVTIVVQPGPPSLGQALSTWMHGAWDELDANGYVPRSVEAIDRDLEEMRAESEARQDCIEAMQDECRLARDAKP